MNMKKHILSYLIILPLLVFFSCSGTNDATTNDKNDTTKVDAGKEEASVVGKIDKEYKLDLDPHLLQLTKLDTELIDFNNEFKLRDNERFIQVVESVKFYDLIDTLLSIQTGRDGYYISGVWVGYTLTYNNEIKYYFIPALATTSDTVVQPVIFKYSLDFKNENLSTILGNPYNLVYEIRNNLLIKTSNDSVLVHNARAYWSNYKSKILVPDVSYSSGRSFNDKDGIFVYFPIQELYKLWKDNGESTLDDGTLLPAQNKFLHIIPSAKKYGTKVDKQHYVNLFCTEELYTPKYLSSVDQIIIDKAINFMNKSRKSNLKIDRKDAFLMALVFVNKSNFRGLAANYGQLCPTRCSELKIVNRKISK